MLIYRTISIIFGLLVLVLGGVSGYRPGLGGRLSRHRWLGLALGTIALTWCAWEGAAMVPERWVTLIWWSLPAVLVLSFLTLDFLTARALGGILALLANYVIQHAFAYNCAARPFYAVVALAWGLLGLVLIAWPWYLRDALEWPVGNPGRRRLAQIIALVSALPLILLPFLGAVL